MKTITFIKSKNNIHTIFYEVIGKKVTLFCYKEVNKWVLEIHTENLEVIEKKFNSKRAVKKDLKNRSFFAEDLKELNNIKRVRFSLFERN